MTKKKTGLFDCDRMWGCLFLQFLHSIPRSMYMYNSSIYLHTLSAFHYYTSLMQHRIFERISYIHEQMNTHTQIVYASYLAILILSAISNNPVNIWIWTMRELHSWVRLVPASMLAIAFEYRFRNDFNGKCLYFVRVYMLWWCVLRTCICDCVVVGCICMCMAWMIVASNNSSCDELDYLFFSSKFGFFLSSIFVPYAWTL